MDNGLHKPIIKESLSEESDSIINKFMWSNPVGVLALVDSDGKPHAATIYYSTDDNFVITFTTKELTKKGKILAKNSSVVLVAYDAETQTTLQVVGDAVLIKGFEDAKEAFDNTIKNAGRTSDELVPPIAKIYAGKYEAYQILPKHIHMNVFTANDPDQNDTYRYIEFED